MTIKREISLKAPLKLCCFPQSIYICFGIFTLAIISEVSEIKTKPQQVLPGKKSKLQLQQALWNRIDRF